MRTSPKSSGPRAVAAILCALASACGTGQNIAASYEVCADCHASVLATGAHGAHVASLARARYGDVGAAAEWGADGPRYTFGCGSCHPLDPRRHRDGRVEVELFSADAAPGSPKAQSATDATYAQGRCAGAYCHGGGGQAWGRNLPTPEWTAAPARLACDACHLAPPATGAHLAHVGDPDAATLVRWADVRTLADYKPGGGPAYLFGCGSCHPLEASPHVNGAVEVSLDPASAPYGALRAENADDAGFAAGTCAGVYCHSSGQRRSVRTYVATPDWWAGAGTLGCGGCHGNPPAYAGGTPGDGANSHLVGYGGQWGRIRGHVVAAMHGRENHGHWFGHNEPDMEGSPITCQTCHAGTVDPTNVGSTGFYWYDTSGDYSFPGESTPVVCSACHTGGPGELSAGKGKVLPLLHVNGKRDVEFDRRETLPNGYPGLPAGIPARPYWEYQADGIGLDQATQNALPIVLQQTGWATPQGAYAWVLSFNLKDAVWDPRTKSCSSVVCHLQQQNFVWGNEPFDCRKCHPQ
jgi:predicted CxxxxCH...CXXCH cytochrome family protein